MSKKINASSQNPIDILINLSEVQLNDHYLYDKLVSVLNRIKVSPSQIVLEIPEDLLIDSVKQEKSVINKLIKEGFTLGLCDFGSYKNTLMYFEKLPIKYIRVSKGLSAKVSTNSYEKDIILMMSTLSHFRDIKLIVQEVQTQEQLEVLTSVNCDLVQGSYISEFLTTHEAYKSVVNIEDTSIE